jgi:hypothetical protein
MPRTSRCGASTSASASPGPAHPRVPERREARVPDDPGLGSHVEATANHKFRTIDGWTPLGDLAPAPASRCPAASTPMNVEGDGQRRAGPARPPPRRRLRAAAPAGPLHEHRPGQPRCGRASRGAPVRDHPRRVQRRSGGGTPTSRRPSTSPTASGTRSPPGGTSSGSTTAAATRSSCPDVVHAAPLHQVHCSCGTSGRPMAPSSLNRSGKGPTVRIMYTTTSRTLADDVQRLLLRCGIQSRISVVPQGRAPAVPPRAHRRVWSTSGGSSTEIGVHGRNGALGWKPGARTARRMSLRTRRRHHPVRGPPADHRGACPRPGSPSEQLALPSSESSTAGATCWGRPSRPRSMRRGRA